MRRTSRRQCGRLDVLAGARFFREVGFGAVKINHAKDPARPVGRERATSALREDHGTVPESASRVEDTVPLARSGRIVRVHWGIVLAIVSSLILWFAIKTVIGLAL
jgi:hypothetical protein